MLLESVNAFVNWPLDIANNIFKAIVTGEVVSHGKGLKLLYKLVHFIISSPKCLWCIARTRRREIMFHAYYCSCLSHDKLWMYEGILLTLAPQLLVWSLIEFVMGDCPAEVEYKLFDEWCRVSFYVIVIKAPFDKQWIFDQVCRLNCIWICQNNLWTCQELLAGWSWSACFQFIKLNWNMFLKLKLLCAIDRT